MTNQEINEKIGELLGFTKHDEKYHIHWTYPKQYEHLVCSVPNNTLPNFIKIIDLVIDLQTKLRYGIPREFFYKESIDK
jgi:hypothetical protein